MRPGKAATTKRRLLPSDSTEAVTVVIYKGTLGLIVLFIVIFMFNVFALGNYYALTRVFGLLPLAALGIVLRLCYARRKFKVVAGLLLALYAFIGFTTLALWSINAPTGLLVFGFVIVLAGGMLGGRSIVPVTAGLIGIMAVLELLHKAGITHPDVNDLANIPNIADFATWTVLFSLFALVSWLGGRRMELALARALKAESDLAAEKESLAARLEQKTREVKDAQMEEMRQLYQFAELGQLGTVLLHDLANNLTALTLDIDDIGQTPARAEPIARAKESIGYLGRLIDGARRQLDRRDTPIVFDARAALIETLDVLEPKAGRAGVSLEYDHATDGPIMVKGDPFRFGHIVTILVNNAIEAYDAAPSDGHEPYVNVSATVSANRLTIRVTDHGKGITASGRARLFQPFGSTKPNGMGIGLFMAHEMAKRYFKARLTISPRHDETTFVFSLPRVGRHDR